MKRFNLGERLRRIFGRPESSAGLYEALETELIEADVGAAVAASLLSELKQAEKERRADDRTDPVSLLKALMGRWLAAAEIVPRRDELTVLLVLGVNGVGKTTTIAKLAAFYRDRYGLDNILLGAADTFRAAAGEQLALWGERLGLKVVRQAQGADPGAVVFDSLESAAAKRAPLLIIDTSGRMHNKEQLVKELAKIDKIVRSKLPPSGVYHKILVIDATTGQNALRQAEAFQNAVGIDSIALTKLDSSAKGGIAVAIGRELSLPISFLGSGEKLEDLEPFRSEAYLDALFDRA